MSPRSTRIKTLTLYQEERVHGLQPSRDRWRNMETEKHHPRVQLRPDRPHIAAPKPRTGQWHTTHVDPHGVERGPHTDKPSPIRFRATIKQRGIRH